MVIETERLLLRPMRMGDLDDLVALHAEPAVNQFMTRFDRRSARERLLDDRRDWRERGHGLLAVIDRANRSWLGRTGLKYCPQFEEIEVGWALRPEVWGLGLAGEAARACVDWGFRATEAPYFTAMIHPDNPRSVRVAERLGMAPLRRDILRDTPVVVYWLERPKASSEVR
jgi:RimJ/RimL family protein N-acetyltransferase